MVVYDVITIMCLVVMLFGVASVAYNLVVKKREEKIAYIRGFKKGKGVLAYFFAVPLYCIGMCYSGTSFFSALFKALRKIVDMLVLNFDVEPVRGLMDVNPLFAAAIYVCFVLAVLNAVMFAASVAHQYIWVFIKRLEFGLTKKEKLYLFGNNGRNYSVYDSDKSRKKIIVDNISDAEASALFMKGYVFDDVFRQKNYIEKIVKDCAGDKKSYVVINTENEDENIKLARCFTEAIGKLGEDEKKNCFDNFRAFVFGDPKYEAIYEEIVANGFGCVSYENKYMMVAVDFIDKYPFTEFMGERQIDYKSSLLKEGVEVNVVMVGFGKTNRQIFLSSVANNQFIVKGEKGVELKKVNYHIFDKLEAENDKNLNHDYNRYKNECAGVNPKDYLPLPDAPANEKFYCLDVNDDDFYKEIRKALSIGKNNVNFAIIAFGTDLENIDMAQKLVVKRREWGVENLNVFVKVRNENNDVLLRSETDCYPIANEKNAVYNIDKILGDRLWKMARLRNEVYRIEYEIKQSGEDVSEEKIARIKKEADYDWYYRKTQTERDSNLYGCLSLRMKLNLVGLDYVPVEDEKRTGLSENEYLDIYAAGDKPDTSYYKAKAEGKPIVRYTLSFSESRRKNLAVHEHLRWNSFMISKGVIPATIAEINGEEVCVNGEKKHTNGRNYLLRRHGCLTTFDGLVEYRKIVAKNSMKPGETELQAEERSDVIRYDYQLLDDAYWLLESVGQKIVLKK